MTPSLPPTHELRQEWRRLRVETRRRVFGVVSELPYGGPTDDFVSRLIELGLSPDLARWAVEHGQEHLRDLESRLLRDRLERETPRVPLDHFNRMVMWLFWTLVGAIWVVQEWYVVQRGTMPIGLPLAVLLLLFGATGCVRSFRRWLRALREPRE